MSEISERNYNSIIQQVNERVKRNNENYQFLCSFEKRKNTYRELLNRTGLLTERQTAGIFPLKNGTRKSVSLAATKGLCMYSSSNNYYARFEDFGIRPISEIENSIVKEHVIYLNKRDDIYVNSVFEKSYKAPSLSINSIPRELSFINLPLFFYNLIKEPYFLERRMDFEKFLSKNQKSTFSNVYSYVKDNMEEIEKIPSKIYTLSHLIEDNANLYYSESFNFVRNLKSFGRFRIFREGRAIPYDIYSSGSGDVVKVQMNLNILREDKELYNFIPLILSFPITMFFDKNKMEAGYISKEDLISLISSQRIAITPSYTDSIKFLSMDEMSKILLDYEENRAKGITEKFNLFKKPFFGREKKMLERNVQLVISELMKSFTELSSFDSTLEMGNEHIEKLKANCDRIDDIFSELSNVLVKIYRNEILFNSL